MLLSAWRNMKQLRTVSEGETERRGLLRCMQAVCDDTADNLRIMMPRWHDIGRLIRAAHVFGGVRKKAIKFQAAQQSKPPCLSVPAMTFLRFFRTIRPAAPEEADGNSEEVFPPPPSCHPLTSPPNNYIQYSQSRVHPREDECAVSMPVGGEKKERPTTLYKHCTGPHTARMSFICLSGPP